MWVSLECSNLLKTPIPLLFQGFRVKPQQVCAVCYFYLSILYCISPFARFSKWNVHVAVWCSRGQTCWMRMELSSWTYFTFFCSLKKGGGDTYVVFICGKLVLPRRAENIRAAWWENRNISWCLANARILIVVTIATFTWTHIIGIKAWSQ